MSLRCGARVEDGVVANPGTSMVRSERTAEAIAHCPSNPEYLTGQSIFLLLNLKLASYSLTLGSILLQHGVHYELALPCSAICCL